MTNENLKTALKNAGMTPEEFASIVQVDPKSVQRWIAGTTTPYPRHRAKISRALDLAEHELWPERVAAPGSPAVNARPPESGVGGVIGAWGHSNDHGAPDPTSLLAGTVQEVDVLDSAGTLLKASGMLAALAKSAVDGAAIRLLTSNQTLAPGTGSGPDRIACRTPSADQSDLIVLRVDDTMLLALQLHDDEGPALLALHRDSAGIFARLAEWFNVLWEAAEEPGQLVAAPAVPEARPAQEPAIDGSPPRRWPRVPERLTS